MRSGYGGHVQGFVHRTGVHTKSIETMAKFLRIKRSL